jgi:prepilin peptidase CpaA
MPWLDVMLAAVSAAPLGAGLVAVMTVGAWLDVRTRRIPNTLTVTAVLLALTVRLLAGSFTLVDGLLGFGLAFAVLLPLSALGGVGGGDAKLLLAAGAFLGPKGFVVALLATAVVGGVLSAAYATRRGVILPALLGTRGLLLYVFSAGRRGERSTGAVSVPYGVAIAAGSLFALWYTGAWLG